MREANFHLGLGVRCTEYTQVYSETSQCLETGAYKLQAQGKGVPAGVQTAL